MNYKERINRVVDFIGEHLDDELTLDQLSSVACFSKYHFHRLFTAYTGLSLKQYIKWLRLKRAAHKLIVERDSTIIEIAFDAGFGVYFTNEKLSIGAAASQLIGAKLQLTDVPNTTLGGRLYRHYNFSANYKIQTGEDVFVVPFTMVRLIENSPTEVDLGAKVDYQDKIWWALDWRVNQFWSLQAGMKLFQRVRASYSYDYYTSPINIYSDGAHEVGLQFDLKKK
jgi:type IX secretion system PorP/SprF family membrane protein